MPTPSRRNQLVIALVLVPLLGLAGWLGGGWVRFWSHERAARAALERRDFATAREQLRRCLALAPGHADTLLLAAQTARRAGEPGEAGKFLDAALLAGAVREAVELERRLLRLQSGDLTDAEAVLATSRKQPDNPHSPLLLEALIVGSLNAMHFGLADRAITLWVELRPGAFDQAQGFLWRGEAAVRRGDGEGALMEYRKALNLTPENEKARRKAAEILVRYDAPEALTLLEPLLEKYPSDRSLRLLLARCRRAMGDMEEARRLLDELLATRSDESQLLLERGLIELDLGQAAAAEPWLRRAVEAAPSLRDPNAAMARCLRLLGKADAVEFEKRTQRIDAEIQEKIDKLFGQQRDPK